MAELSVQQQIAEAVRRRCVGPCGLSPDGARVLGAIVTRVADGVAVPHQEVLAAELGLPLRTLSRSISQLGRAHGLVFVQRVGREPARYHIDWTELEAWAGVRCAKEGFDTPPWRDEQGVRCAKEGFDTPPWRDEHVRYAKEGVDAPPWRIERPVPRAHASTSSSSSSTSSTSSTPTSSTEAYQEHAAMLAVLKRWGISTANPGAKEYVWRWVGKYPVARVEAAAQAAWKHRAQHVAYMESVLEDEDSNATFPPAEGERVVEIEAYRGLRPWVGA